MAKKFTHEDLAAYVKGLRFFSAEWVAKDLNVDKADVQRAIQELRIQPGWSITISNRIPENRMYGQGLSRSKHRKSTDCHDWEPTFYVINKFPKSDD